MRLRVASRASQQAVPSLGWCGRWCDPQPKAFCPTVTLLHAPPRYITGAAWQACGVGLYPI
jgi:hypothetical protein